MDGSQSEQENDTIHDGRGTAQRAAMDQSARTGANSTGAHTEKNEPRHRMAPDHMTAEREGGLDSLLVARRSSRLAFALVLGSLLLLAILPMLIRTRTQQLNGYITDVIGPVRARLTTFQGALALEVAGTRGYLITGDTQYVDDFRSARASRDSALEVLRRFVPELSPAAVDRMAELTQRLHTTDTLADALYAGRVSPGTFRARLGEQQARLDQIIAEGTQLDIIADSISLVRRSQIGTLQRVGGFVTVVLVALALVAAALVARLGHRYLALALRLDVHAREQAALARIARALGAAEHTSDVVQTVAVSALQSSGAAGAYVTRLRRAPIVSEAEVVASAGRGTPAVGSLVPLGGAPDTALVTPLMDRGVIIGDLVLVRAPDAPPFTPAHVAHANALGDLASAALRRLALLEALSESDQRFRQVAENISEFIWLSDPELTKRYYVSSGYERIWGRTAQSLYEDPESALEFVHPEDRERVRIATRGEGQPPGHFDLEYRIVRPDGEIRWVRSRGFPVRNERGEVYRVAGITEDITGRKTAEREREQLLASERAARTDAEQKQQALVEVTESRTRLMRGFTHDVKNPLGAADGSLELLEDNIVGDLTPKQLGIVRRSRHSIRIALDLIGHLLDVAQAESGQLDLHVEPLNLCLIVRDVAEEFHDQAETRRLTLVLALPESPPPVENDPARVRQIVANLVSNAVKYTPAGGAVTVRVGQRRNNGEAHQGQWAVVDVTDTGSGIALEQQPKLFQEFVRFNPGAADGSGIGLAISQRVARALGGEIRVQSELGVGSTFTLWLPTS